MQGKELEDVTVIRDVRDIEPIRIQEQRIEQLEAALRGLLTLRADTEMTYEAAYHSMFKSQGIAAWNAAQQALQPSPLTAQEMEERA